MMLPTDRQASSISVICIYDCRPIRADYDGGIVNDVDDATIVMSERRLYGIVE